MSVDNKAGEAFQRLLDKLDIEPEDIIENSDNMVLTDTKTKADFIVFVDLIPENEEPINIFDEEIQTEE